MGVKKKIVAVSGVELDAYALHTILIVTVPGSEVKERATVAKTLLTSEGELVFITKPYKNLSVPAAIPPALHPPLDP